MHIDVHIVGISEKPLIQRMMQLYQYDFSEFDGTDLDEHGAFCYNYLDHYWVEDSRTPLLVRINGKIGGFVLVNKYSYTGSDKYCIAEFFIMRKYRRNGIGRQVAHKVFNRFGPLWEIRETALNVAAQAFWMKVVDEYTDGNFENHSTGYGDWSGPIQTFSSKDKS